jgi:hypothetical protein
MMMLEPILKISVSPSGLIRIDASVRTEEDRARIFDFYNKVLTEIQAFDTAIRHKRGNPSLHKT